MVMLGGAYAHIDACGEVVSLVIEGAENVERKQLGSPVSVTAVRRDREEQTRAATTWVPSLVNHGLPRSFIWKHPGSFSRDSWIPPGQCCQSLLSSVETL